MVVIILFCGIFGLSCVFIYQYFILSFINIVYLYFVTKNAAEYKQIIFVEIHYNMNRAFFPDRNGVGISFTELNWVLLRE